MGDLKFLNLNQSDKGLIRQIVVFHLGKDNAFSWLYGFRYKPVVLLLSGNIDVSAAVPPDFSAASFLRLWESSIYSHGSDSNSPNLTKELRFKDKIIIQSVNHYSLRNETQLFWPHKVTYTAGSQQLPHVNQKLQHHLLFNHWRMPTTCVMNTQFLSRVEPGGDLKLQRFSAMFWYLTTHWKEPVQIIRASCRSHVFMPQSPGQFWTTSGFLFRFRPFW